MHDIARTLGDPTRPPEPRFAESTGRRGGGAALECQTLEVRERVRRSFVTDLAGFRHLRIRQPLGLSSLGLRGPDLALR